MSASSMQFESTSNLAFRARGLRRSSPVPPSASTGHPRRTSLTRYLLPEPPAEPAEPAEPEAPAAPEAPAEPEAPDEPDAPDAPAASLPDVPLFPEQPFCFHCGSVGDICWQSVPPPPFLPFATCEEDDEPEVVASLFATVALCFALDVLSADEELLFFALLLLAEEAPVLLESLLLP